MNSRLLRILIPVIVAAVALGIVVLGFIGPPRQATPATTSKASPGQPVPESAASSPPPATGSVDAAKPSASAPAPGASPTGGDVPAADPSDATAPGPAPGIGPAPRPGAEPLHGLRTVAAPGGVTDPAIMPAALGSLDPRRDRIEVRFTRASAGIDRIALSDAWLTAAADRQARAHYRALDAGDPDPPPLPDEALRDVLKATQPLQFGYDGPAWPIAVLAAHSVRINGQDVPLLDRRESDGAVTHAWTETAPGEFRAQIVDGDGRPVLDIVRRFVMATHGNGFTLQQRLTNLIDQPLDVRWVQYGPGELELDRSRYLDRRRFRFGYLLAPSADPARILVFSDDTSLLLEHATVAKQSDPLHKSYTYAHSILWPNSTSATKGYELSWFGSTNRYFGLAIHPVIVDPATDSRSLAAVVDRIEGIAPGASDSDQPRPIFTNLFSPVKTIAPGRTAALDLGVYAGPLDRHVLGKVEPYRILSMDGLIIYMMSGMCSWCTFQWLAHVLLWFLSAVHAVVFDWGLAIIVLVCVVRLLLHPITKKSQVSMQRFGRAMQAIKPELDQLQKKFVGDAKKLQAEQLRLMREHGVSPFGCLAFLPLLLQTPIWIALYAMLYFAFDLRQQPAFWGVFQWISGGHWNFLADLSAADHFFWEFRQPFVFLMWNVTGINLLPLLMGVVFYVQQKYMTPPAAATLTREQLQQQKIMKLVTVVMFPLMLYSAPSGLTLYIFTSSLIGIVESRYIRRHVDQAAAKRAPAGATSEPPRTLEALFGKSGGKARDPRGRAFADAIERAKSRRQPPRSFKDRKD